MALALTYQNLPTKQHANTHSDVEMSSKSIQTTKIKKGSKCDDHGVLCIAICNTQLAHQTLNKGYNAENKYTFSKSAKVRSTKYVSTLT